MNAAKKLIRTLHIIQSLNPKNGGVAHVVKTFASELVRQFVLCEIVTLDLPGEEHCTDKNVPCHYLGVKNNGWGYSSKLSPWLTENLEKFDVVIVHGLWLYPGYATMNAVSNLKRNAPSKAPRFYVMPHGMLDPYFQRAKERRLKALRNIIYWQLVERKVVNIADGLLFTCEMELLLARETFKQYNPQKEHVIGYGIKPPPQYNPEMQTAFRSCCTGLNKEPYLLFLGRIHPKKGVDILIDAYIDLYYKSVALPKLVIAGPGKHTSYGENLQAQLSNYPEVKKSIFFTDMLTGDAKWGSFYECEAFILPSHQENFGIAVVEALACGKPVLISDQVNIWKEINKEGAGLVKSDSLTGVKKMIRKWVNFTQEEKFKLSDNAINTYHKYFILNTSIEKLISIIKDDKLIIS
ncbi:MAG: hypothetical protein JWP44_2430 [Mucilaginibacter sp.]|nr:hypothetical protein [Mucilaginibacter sp.]